MTKQEYTLESIEDSRDKLYSEAEKQATRIKENLNNLFAPPATETKVQTWVAQAERAVAVYDGVMLGWKLFRQFRNLVPLHKKKRK